MAEIAVVDYGMGNLSSVVQAFSAVGQSAEITCSPAALAAAAAIVIPGVGAFGANRQLHGSARPHLNRVHLGRLDLRQQRHRALRRFDSV